MKIESQTEAVNLLIKSLPHPELIDDINTARPGAVYFRWRYNSYKLTLEYCSVERVLNVGGILEGDDTSMLIEHLLKTNLKSKQA